MQNMHYFQCNVTEMDQGRTGNSNITYSAVKTYHQPELDHSRGNNGTTSGATTGNGNGGGGVSGDNGGNANTNYISTSSKYQTGMTQLTTRPAYSNEQLSEMERAHAKYQIEMEMARQKYQAEIEQAAAKYQTVVATNDDLEKTREPEVHYKYQTVTDLDQEGVRGNGNAATSYTELKYHNAFRPSPDLQQQQQQQQQQHQTGNIQVANYVNSPLEYHQASTPTPTAIVISTANNATVSTSSPTKKRKKKPIDPNKVRKRCIYQRRMWTEQESEAVIRQLGEYFSSARLPGKKDIEDALQREDILAGRSWKNIKDFIRNKTSPRIPRRPPPTQVPMSVPVQVVQHQQPEPQQTSTIANMVVTNTMGEMITIPITSQAQHALDVKLGLLSQQHTMQQPQQQQPPQAHIHHQQHQQQQPQIHVQTIQQHHQQQLASTSTPNIAPPTTTTVPKKRRKKIKAEKGEVKRRIIARRDWSGAEKAAVLHYFGDYVSRQKLPGKKDIEECLSKEEILSFRTWRNVKDFIRNTTQAHIKREALFGTGSPDFGLLS